MNEPGVHDPENVRSLFDEMAKTYGYVHLFSSLGFAYFWRKACARQIPRESLQVLDVMSGSGECVTHLIPWLGAATKIQMVDFSASMCAAAQRNLNRWKNPNVEVLNGDALSLPFRDDGFDAVTSTFGLKTLSMDQLAQFARELYRVVRPGGVVSLLEFSIPDRPYLIPFFRFYVKHYVPFLGRIFLGNPDNYRMLWKYTVGFGDCSTAMPAFRAAGFKLELRRYFFGSATHLVGWK
ncbi:MAG TPA: class I SAM-dependent methyltransferase [Opitutaceae bacterium]|nr:class I SAM-dependent methyltransferase [Opitutaceae bacterium]